MVVAVVRAATAVEKVLSKRLIVYVSVTVRALTASLGRAVLLLLFLFTASDGMIFKENSHGFFVQFSNLTMLARGLTLVDGHGVQAGVLDPTLAQDSGKLFLLVTVSSRSSRFVNLTNVEQSVHDKGLDKSVGDVQSLDGGRALVDVRVDPAKGVVVVLHCV